MHISRYPFMRGISKTCGLVTLLSSIFLAATGARADQTIKYWLFPNEYWSIDESDRYDGTCHVAIGTDTKLPAGHYAVNLKGEDYHKASGWTYFSYIDVWFDVNDKGLVTTSDTVGLPLSIHIGGGGWYWEDFPTNPGKTRWTAYFQGKLLQKLTTISQSPAFAVLPVDYHNPPSKFISHYKEEFPVQPHCKPCEACASGNCSNGGGTSAGLHSLDYTIDLGRNRLDDFSVANRLTLTAITATPQLTDPASLEVNYANENGNETIFSQGSVPRQVVGPQTMADIVVLSPFKYQISLYPATAKGGKDSGTGLYVPTVSPSKVITIENPDQSAMVYNRLHITEVPASGSGDGPRDYLYVNTGVDVIKHLNGQWELVSSGGQRHETLVSVPNDANNRTETRTITDAVGKVISQVQRQYRMYTWGEEIVSETVDPGGAALTTTYDYWHVDIPDSGNPPPDPYRNWASHLRQKIDPNGHWERYEYDSLSRPTKKVVQFMDAPLNAPDAQCRVTTTSYLDTTPLMETEIETLQGVEVSRRYRRYFPQGKAQEIVCQHAGAAWDDASNLVTTTVIDQNGNVVSTLMPDGTLTTYSELVAGSNKTTITATGAPSADGTTVVDGTSVSTVSDAGGQQLMQVTQDLASGLLLSSATTSQTDTLGRPTRVVYDDGSSELTSYDCCGVSSRTDRNGVTTTYTYDALHQLESESRAGVTNHYTNDATGRRLSTMREGSDGSRIIVERLAYDVAGRQISRTDAEGNATTSAETIDAATGHTVRTTTLPDETHSTRVETIAQDGSLLSVGGTAAHPLSYVYGADASLGAWTQEIRLGDQGASTEWTKTYTDAAGRSYRTETAAGAVAQSFFNAQGQTVRTVDPDGVTTLYGYNARGEQDTLALDMDRNGQIDFAGTDRITRTTRVVVHAHDTTVSRITTSAWTADGVDAAAVITVDEQSADGRASWHTDAGGLVTHTLTSCDGAGTCTTTVTSPDGSYAVEVTQAGRAVSQTRYDADSQVLSGATADYEPQGRLWHQTDRRNGLTTYIYDNADRLRQVSHAGQTTGYDYDALGRKKLQTEPDKGQIQTLYWPAGEVKSLRGVRTYPQEYTYDSQGRLKTLTTHGASGAAVTTWNYDGQSGQMTGKVYVDGKGPGYTYTLGGRLHTRTWARGIVTTYSYDNSGQLQSVTYSDGTTPVGGYSYDRLGRLVTASGGGSARTLTYQGNTSLLSSETATAGPLTGMSVGTGYDGLLRRTSSAVSKGGTNMLSQSFGFDAASRLANATQGTASAAYTYWPSSASNLVQTITFKNSGQPAMNTAKIYDTLDRLGSIVSTVQGAAAPVAGYAYSYNAANERIRADVVVDGTHWLYGYDALGQVTSAGRQWSDNGAVAGQQFGYAYDTIGNRTSVSTNGRQSTYTSNALNQYGQRTVPGAVDVVGTAEPDAVVALNGQPTVRQQDGYFADTAVLDNHQGAVEVPVQVSAVKPGASVGGGVLATQTGSVFVPQTPEQFSYDLDGNLTQDGRWIYAWDGENRLISMEALGSLPAIERKKLTFGYDDLGRRVQKQVWIRNAMANAYQASTNTLFAYNGWNLVAELDGGNSNALLRSYLWGLDLSGSAQGAGGVGGLLAINDQTTNANLGAQSHFACFDGNGNVVALVKAQDGSISAVYDYGAFGETLRMTGTIAQTNAMRFSNKFTDSESGLCYYGYRFYNTEIGRWINRDPLEERASINIYSFCGNTQPNRIDRFGLSDAALTAAGASLSTTSAAAEAAGPATGAALADSAGVSAFAGSLGTTGTTGGAAGTVGGLSTTASTGIGAIVLLAAGAVTEQVAPQVFDPIFDPLTGQGQQSLDDELANSKFCEFGMCDKFANFAATRFKKRRKKYRFVEYKSYDRNINGIISDFVRDVQVATNGYHAGLLDEFDAVHDPLYPAGIELRAWIEVYQVRDPQRKSGLPFVPFSNAERVCIGKWRIVDALTPALP